MPLSIDFYLLKISSEPALDRYRLRLLLCIRWQWALWFFDFYGDWLLPCYLRFLFIFLDFRLFVCSNDLLIVTYCKYIANSFSHAVKLGRRKFQSMHRSLRQPYIQRTFIIFLGPNVCDMSKIQCKDGIFCLNRSKSTCLQI